MTQSGFSYGTSFLEKFQHIVQTRMFFVLMILTIAMFLRTYQWGYYPFGFDQIQMVENAEKILQGDPSLIGPRTGPADMFTGPFVYYWMAGWLMFVELPYTVVPFSVSLALITGLVLAWLVFRYLPASQAKLILIIWACSPFIIPFDRLPWNPNLTLLATSCIFFPLMYLIEDRKRSVRWVDVLSMSVGAFLGYQAHFSGLLLPFLAIGMLVIFRPKQWKPMLGVGMGFVLSLIPTILFDLRNNYLNARGLLSLINNKDEVSNFLIVPRFADNLHISAEILGKVLLAGNHYYLLLLVGFSCIGAVLWFAYQQRGLAQQRLLFSISWGVAISFAFALYRLNKPEYYYFIELPAFFFILSVCLQKIVNTNTKIYGFTAVFSIYAFAITFAEKPLADLVISNQAATVAAVEKTTQDHAISEVVYDLEHLDAMGVKYLLSKKNLTIQENGQKLHIIYPVFETTLVTQRWWAVGIWLDPRMDVTKNYLSRPGYIIGTSHELQLLQDYYSSKTNIYPEVFQVLQDGQQVGWMSVITRTGKNTQQYDTLKNDVLTGTIRAYDPTGENPSQWAIIQEDKQTIFVYESVDTQSGGNLQFEFF